MTRLFYLLGLAIIVGCGSINNVGKPTVRSAVDTEGDSLIDSTALGDIDMAETTVGDFKSIIAPNYSNVSNAAMSASGSISEIQDFLESETVTYDQATNMIWNVSLMTAKYYYASRTQTTYKLITDNDFIVMQAVTNVPPSASVILKLEGYRQ